MSETIVITVSDFREVFPEFSDTEKYSDAVIQSFITQAEVYISPEDNSCFGILTGNARKLAIELLIAHLLVLNGVAGTSSNEGQIASKSVGSVSVSFVAPQNKSQFEYWLNKTSYGQRLLSLLTLKAPAFGLYVGGSIQRVL